MAQQSGNFGNLEFFMEICLIKEVAHCFDYSWILNFMSYIERDSKDTPIPKFPIQLGNYSSL